MPLRLFFSEFFRLPLFFLYQAGTTGTSKSTTIFVRIPAYQVPVLFNKRHHYYLVRSFAEVTEGGDDAWGGRGPEVEVVWTQGGG